MTRCGYLLRLLAFACGGSLAIAVAAGPAVAFSSLTLDRSADVDLARGPREEVCRGWALRRQRFDRGRSVLGARQYR